MCLCVWYREEGVDRVKVVVVVVVVVVIVVVVVVVEGVR